MQPQAKEDDNQTLAAPVRYGAVEGQDARMIADAARDAFMQNKIHIHVVTDEERLHTLEALLEHFAPDVKMIAFPAWDCLPYDRVSPHADITSARLKALSQLLETRSVPTILITSAHAISQRVIPRARLQSSSLSVRKGKKLNQKHFSDFLQQNGYNRTDTVREPGEYALRGGIIDIYPSGAEVPLRLDLFGDDIESIKTFDPMTQSSRDEAEGFDVYPASDVFFDETTIESFRRNYRLAFGAVTSDDPLYNAISEGRRYNGMEHWLPFFYDRMETLFDYAGPASLTCDLQTLQAVQEHEKQVHEFYDARVTLQEAAKKGAKRNKDVSLTGDTYQPIKPSLLYIPQEELQAAFAQHTPVILSPYSGGDAHEARPARDFSDIRVQPDGNVLKEAALYIRQLQADKKQMFVFAYSEGSGARLETLLKEQGAAKFTLAVVPLTRGFVADDIAVLTEQDILGDRLVRKAKRRKKADQFLTDLNTLNPGDLVVHTDHGVGRFEGLETLKAGGLLHDCLKLTYDGGDRLYVPVEHMELLSRFGSDEGFSQLDKLGGAGWQARKARVKKNLLEMAEALLKVAAQRAMQKGEKLHVEEVDYRHFVAGFPYHETDDQLRAITDVTEDMDSGRPMDRLVCGDVGFGKTEVALRAAYIAAKAGTQVAVIAPTTLLVNQHYINFKKRFASSGLRIEMLSRFTSAKDAERIKQEMVTGTVNIVIGTHALLAESIKFAHLGLVVVDEEQRFGVKQKERLKNLRNNVHVLTLTATPIPRTLQMALTGVREMSIIATPPVDRMAINTFVTPFDPLIIREAIMRERFRGGQTFYVVPRIQDIPDLELQLKELVPEASMIVAHGQMPTTDLEKRMEAFLERKYDILLSTQIIESGLDIPTANTMIIHRSDMFGLAQLYQLRGRVGRSKVRAYAYLTFLPDAKLTPQAHKRLEVLQMLDTLGAGFQLASHDLDIRGAGNLLGEEQSGHIKEVGVELYQQMLEEAVTLAKAGVSLKDIQDQEDWVPNINIGTSILIPEDYVVDLTIRMGLYRRLSSLKTEDEVESFAADMIDRFGKLPPEVENLLDIVKIKLLCRKAHIDRVEAGPKGAVIGFYKDIPAAPEKMLQWIASQQGLVKLRPDQKLAIIGDWHSVPQRVKMIKKLLQQIPY
ncbi:MAG: transcription-repair coupling factor [Alphaproteobacteria bacterium]|nr:transcription-repair coupling factor [Alphaproteobacteria bacterium]